MKINKELEQKVDSLKKMNKFQKQDITKINEAQKYIAKENEIKNLKLLIEAEKNKARNNQAERSLK